MSELEDYVPIELLQEEREILKRIEFEHKCLREVRNKIKKIRQKHYDQDQQKLFK